MTGGIATFVLVLHLNGGTVAIPGYGSIAECERAQQMFMRQVSFGMGVKGAYCIPGPVERAQ